MNETVSTQPQRRGVQAGCRKAAGGDISWNQNGGSSWRRLDFSVPAAADRKAPMTGIPTRVSGAKVCHLPPLADALAAGSPGALIFDPAAWKELRSLFRLSRGELNLARAVFDGRTQTQMARSTGTSTYFVHASLVRLHRKLGVEGNVELVLCLTREHLAHRRARAGWAERSCLHHHCGAPA
jgi:hypothetical protein